MDQYNLIPNAFAIYSDCYAKIGDVGYRMSDPEVQNSPLHADLNNQLIVASSLFYTVTQLISLNDDGDAIVGIKTDADLVNTLLIELKDVCGVNPISQFPTPFTTLNYNNTANPYPVGALGAIPVSNGLTYLPFSMGAPGEVLTSTPTGLVWSSVVGNGIPAGGTTGQVLRKVNNTSYNVAWASLTPSDIGVSASVAELNILDGALLSTAELNTLVGINTGVSVQTQLNSKASTVLTNGHFLVGNVSNVATAVTPTGDVTFNNAGVFAIGAGVIVNADVSASAAISRSKLVSGNTYRVIINDNTGVMAEASAIAASRVLVSNVNGVPVHSTISTTTLGFLDATSSIQTQIDSKLTVSLTAPAQGAMLYYNGTNWINFAVGTADQVLTSTGSIPQWGSATANGLPVGGTTNQYLRKIDATNYNTQWHTFVLADVTDVVTTVTELNLLSGLTAAAAALNNVDISTSLQGLLDNKLDNNLSYHSIWIGGPADTAQQVSAGANGSVLTIVSGHPVWQTPPSPTGVLGPGASTDNAIARWNGTAGDAIQNSAIIIDDSNNITGVTTLSSGQISVLNQAAVLLYETGSTNYVGLRAAGTMAADYTITLPAAAPGSNTFLSYDGANYVWATGGGSGSIGGTIAAGQVAYGSGTDTIAGEAAFTYNATDNILTADRFHSSLAADPVATVTNGDLFYSSAAGIIDFRGRINGVWTNITRPGTSSKNATYLIAESERNYITLVDTSGGAVTIDISVDLSAQWCQTFINTGTNAINFTASGGMTLNAVATSCTTQWGWVTLIRSGSNTYYASGALGSGGGGGGTVTSVAMSVPSFLSVAGSPITTTGTFAVTLATQTANTIFAGPTSGGAATPTFRALVLTDLPSGVIQDLQSVMDEGSIATISTAVDINTTNTMSFNADAGLQITAPDVAISGNFVASGASAKIDYGDGENTFQVSAAGAQIIANSSTYTWPTGGQSAGYVLTTNGSGTLSWSATSSGTVTSVAQSFTGGLISVSGSPITTSGTLALTVAGTSGGIPYFSSSSTWASSAALVANALVIGGGTGSAPSTTTTGTGVLTALGVNVGSAGAFITFNGAAGTPSSITLTNGTGLPIATGVSGLGTGVATFLGTPSWTNFSSMITGTAPYWALTGTSTLTGTTVIANGGNSLTFSGAGQFIFNSTFGSNQFQVTGSFTASAAAANGAEFAPTITGRGTSNDSITAVRIAGTLTNNTGVAVNQTGLTIVSSFTGSVVSGPLQSQLRVIAGSSTSGTRIATFTNSSSINRFVFTGDGLMNFTQVVTGSTWDGSVTGMTTGNGVLTISHGLGLPSSSGATVFHTKYTSAATTNNTNTVLNLVWYNPTYTANHTGMTASGILYDPVIAGTQTASLIHYAFRAVSGLSSFGTASAADAWVTLGAGTTAIAAMKILSGTDLTTAVAGCFEYNGTDLRFTKTGTARGTVLISTAVTTEVVVSDTTLTITHAGVTYKILARA